MLGSVGWRWKADEYPQQTGCSPCKSSPQAAFDEWGHTPPLNSVECDTVVKILGHVPPLRALCSACVVWSRPSVRDSRSISRAMRPSKHTLLRTRYTLFCILR